MSRSLVLAAVASLATVSCGFAQVTQDPFPQPIAATEGVITVGFEEFAQLPAGDDGQAARPNILVQEPTTGRIFINDMRGSLYNVGADGQVSTYLDLDDDRWGIQVQSAFSERGFHSFAFHPQFAQQGAPGYGKFYTWTDSEVTDPEPDFVPGGGGNTHDTVLHEWTARDLTSATYDGGAPRELLRLEQPFPNHNAGQIAFRPGAEPGDEDYGLLYIGVADGGSGGDPMDLAQNLGSAFGKIFRIDPLGSNSANGEYGIPSTNPFVGRSGVLGEIYAYGVRNPQRFAWDPANGNLYVADIGQNTVEEVSPVPAGGNLGWNDWEASFRFVDREGVSMDGPRSDPTVVYPIAEYSQDDPLLGRQVAVTGLHVYRRNDIPALNGKILFGDNPSGEVFYVSADDVPDGGQDVIHRVLFRDGNRVRTLLQLIQAKNDAQGVDEASRADLRFGSLADGRVLLLNKRDGTVRLLVP